ncbi:hypothetical protein GCM10027417_02320 [Glutamicibacter endophyticus]
MLGAIGRAHAVTLRRNNRASASSPGQLPELPGALRAARWWWVVLGLVFAGFAGRLLLDEFSAQRNTTTLLFAGLLCAAGIAVAFLASGLWRADRRARSHLTWLGLILALPLFLRFGRYSLLALLILLGVLLLWTPSSIKYFRALHRR